ncbi:MAG: hypothetical protein ABI167_09965 [Nitrosospira sp.]
MKFLKKRCLGFFTSKNIYEGGNDLAQPNFQYEKRQRDLIKKKKQEEKRQRKLDKNKTQSEESTDQSPDAGSTEGAEKP